MYLPKHLMPLPLISASEPSELYIVALNFVLSDGSKIITPSAPIP